MAVGTKDLAIEQLAELDNDRLTEELRKSKEELFNLRFQSATGQLENHGRLKAVKRDIARIYTLLRERELGIRPTVAKAAEPAQPEKKATRRSKKAEETPADEPAAASEDETK